MRTRLSMMTRDLMLDERAQTRSADSASASFDGTAVFAPDRFVGGQRIAGAATILGMQQRVGNAAVRRMLAHGAATVQRDDSDDETTYDDDQANSSSSTNSTSDSSPADESESGESDSSDSDTDNSPSDSTQSDDGGADEAESSDDQPAADQSDQTDATDSDADDSDSEDGGTISLSSSGELEPVTMEGGIYEVTGATTMGNPNPGYTFTVPDVPFRKVGGKVAASGTATATFTTGTVTKMPTVPSSITDKCEIEQYQKTIDGPLQAHEDEHAKRFKTYEGTAKVPFNVTADDESGLNDAVDAVINPVSEKRKTAASDLSGKIDPPGGFKVEPDFSMCKKSGPGWKET